MHILFLDQYSDPGGAQQCLLDLLPAVAERGWRAHLAVPGNGELCARARGCGATVDNIECGPFPAGRKSAWDAARFAAQIARLRRRIAELVQRYDADLVYVNGPRLLPACDARRHATLFHCHSYLGPSNAWIVRRYLAGAMVVGSCNFVLEPLRGHPDLQTVYNGVEGGPRSGPAGGRRVGVIGRIAPEKGQAEFLLAARLVPDARFVICGAPLFGEDRAQAYAAELRRLATGLPVEFLGWREDVREVLRDLDVLVVPSIVPEATTRVVLEAYAAGVPVIASPVGGIPEVVEDGVTGYLADARRSQELAVRIRAVLDARPNALVERAHRRWRERFTLRRYREEMIGKIELATGGECARRSCTTG